MWIMYPGTTLAVASKFEVASLYSFFRSIASTHSYHFVSFRCQMRSFIWSWALVTNVLCGGCGLEDW